MANDSIPTFTPPAPTFSPPKQPTFNGSACTFHPNEPAVSKCARCGKPICQDCYENYQVTSGEYAGEALCYDCCKELVAQNVKQLRKNRLSIALTFILTIIGMVIGGCLGWYYVGQEIVYLVLSACIGGCFWTFIKSWILRIYNTCKGSDSILISLFVGIFVGVIIEIVLSVYRTIRKIIECIIYLIRTSGFIKSDTRALQQMADYMEYTQVVSRNVGVDLATLMNEGSELYDNSYAQEVARRGEAQAEATLRGCVTRINENGEIIRNFAA